MLRKVQEKWTGVELTVKQYKEAKDAYILGSVEDVQAVLEDSLAMMATISSSRFVAGPLCFATHGCFATHATHHLLSVMVMGCSACSTCAVMLFTCTESQVVCF